MKIFLKLFLPLLFCCFTINGYAGGYKVLKKQNDVTISYKSKLNKKSGEYEVYLKLANKSGNHLNIDLEVGFYEDGILKSSSNIINCLNTGILPQIHSITDHDMAQKLDKSVTIEITELTITPVDECRKTDS